MLGAARVFVACPDASIITIVDWLVIPYFFLNSVSVSKSTLRIFVPSGNVDSSVVMSFSILRQVGHHCAWKNRAKGVFPRSDS